VYKTQSSERPAQCANDADDRRPGRPATTTTKTNKKFQSNLGRAASPPLTAENGLARCVCTAHSAAGTLHPHHISHRCTQFRTTTPQIPIGYNGMPHIYPKTDPSSSTISTPSDTPIPRPTALTTPNGIQIQSAIFHNSPTGQTDRQAGRQIDRQMG